MSVNEKQKPFKCQICEKEFGQKSGLKQHIMSVHEKQKPFKCTFLPKRLFKKCNLSAYFKSQHQPLKLISDPSGI
jgi:hypothetical protein